MLFFRFQTDAQVGREEWHVECLPNTCSNEWKVRLLRVLKKTWNWILPCDVSQRSLNSAKTAQQWLDSEEEVRRGVLFVFSDNWCKTIRKHICQQHQVRHLFHVINFVVTPLFFHSISLYFILVPKWRQSGITVFPFFLSTLFKVHIHTTFGVKVFKCLRKKCCFFPLFSLTIWNHSCSVDPLICSHGCISSWNVRSRALKLWCWCYIAERFLSHDVTMIILSHDYLSHVLSHCLSTIMS